MYSLKSSQLAANPLHFFNYAYNNLFGPLHETGAVPLLNDWTRAGLREIFKSLFTPGSEGVLYSQQRVSCLRCPDDAQIPCLNGEVAVVMENSSEYNVMKSLEILGNIFMSERLYQDSYNCYKLAYAYYAARFNSQFVKAREMKKKIARALLEWGRYEDAVEELKQDAQLELCDGPLEMEATVYIKYAYGRSLVALDQFMEAVPYLMDDRLSQLIAEIPEYVELLNSVTEIILNSLGGDNVEFAVCLTKRLFNVFSERMRVGDCPAEVYDFVASFSCELNRNGNQKCLTEVYATAFEIHTDVDKLHTKFLCAAIGCAFSDETEHYKVSIANIASVHNYLLSRVTLEEKPVQNYLLVTARLIFMWAPKDIAVQILKDTSDKMSGLLDLDDINVRFFQACVDGRMHS